MHNITIEQARQHADLAFVWRARLRSGEEIWEQPGVSSDKLPRDEVVGIDYVPTDPIGPLPTLLCNVNLDMGERFVRYWTSVWKQASGMQRLYVFGIQAGDKYALLAHYASCNKMVFAARRPFQPTWEPDAFAMLPPGAITIGGVGSAQCGWLSYGFGGLAEIVGPRAITFRAIRNL